MVLCGLLASLMDCIVPVEGCVVISPNVRLVCSETTWAYDENVNRYCRHMCSGQLQPALNVVFFAM